MSSETTVVHCKKEQYNVYIGRPGPWGNPFPMKGESQRDAVIAQFDEWVARQPWLMDAAYWELRGKTLGCFCKPKACHGDVYVKYTDKPRLVFVFGSNEAGRHGRGAAAYAKNNWGAIQGKGFGHHGNSFALPTKDRDLKVLPLDVIADYADGLSVYAKNNPDLYFQVTRLGCGLAGYKNEDIAPLFENAPSNVLLPGLWEKMLRPETPPRVIIAGSREFTDKQRLFNACDKVLDKIGPFEVVSGGAKGADTLGEDYGFSRGLMVNRFPALWEKEGKPGGHHRNNRMAWFGTHLVDFYNGYSPGSKQMIGRAQAEGLADWVIQF